MSLDELASRNTSELDSALMLAAGRLRHIAGTKWGTRRYMDMDHLQELKKEQAAQLQDAVA